MGTAYAQVGNLSGLDHDMFRANVRFIEEFMDRFNGLQKREDLPERFADRASNLTLLFDRALFKSDQDSLFLQAKEFARAVVDNRYFINYEDTTWYAQVTCQGLYGGQSVEFVLFLFVEQRGKDMYKWVIADARGELFNKPIAKRKNAFFLLPNAHEQSFLSLSRVINNTGKYIDDYVIKSFHTESLSTFLTWVRSGQLKLERILDVEFVFHQIPGYVFKVKEVIRNEVNAGWLIHSLARCEEEVKSAKIASLRHQEQPVVQRPEAERPTTVIPDKLVSVPERSAVDTVPNLTRGESVVQLFGELVRMACETKDLALLKTANRTCLKDKGGFNEASDSLMFAFADSMRLRADSIYSLKLYMAGLKRFFRNEDFYYRLSKIKQIDETEEFYIVSALVYSPFLPQNGVSDLFYVSKKENRITRISVSEFMN